MALIAQLGGGGNVLGADLPSSVRQSRSYFRWSLVRENALFTFPGKQAVMVQ